MREMTTEASHQIPDAGMSCAKVAVVRYYVTRVAGSDVGGHTGTLRKTLSENNER